MQKELFLKTRPPSFREEPLPYPVESKLTRIKRTERTITTPFNGSNPEILAEGDIVQHERFGKGEIISIEGQQPNTTATVEFEKDGRKKLY